MLFRLQGMCWTPLWAPWLWICGFVISGSFHNLQEKRVIWPQFFSIILFCAASYYYRGCFYIFCYFYHYFLSILAVYQVQIILDIIQFYLLFKQRRWVPSSPPIRSGESEGSCFIHQQTPIFQQSETLLFFICNKLLLLSVVSHVLTHLTGRIYLYYKVFEYLNRKRVTSLTSSHISPSSSMLY